MLVVPSIFLLSAAGFGYASPAISSQGAPSARPSDLAAVPVGGNAAGASEPIPESFVSFSIEFSSFPDFAGGLPGRNVFTNTLLDNLGSYQGTKPHIRVGGNTQDFALYDPNLKVAINGTIDPSKSTDYPSIITIGPRFFNSYYTLNATKFIHGFNLGKNSTENHAALIASAQAACKALSNYNLLYWQLGNEPDLFKGHVRPSNYTEEDYVREWKSLVKTLSDTINSTCPNIPNFEKAWYSPAFAGTANSLDPVKTFKAGLNSENNVAMIDLHNYMGGADVPGVTLAGTLMNHTKVKSSVGAHLAVKEKLSGYNLPYILGETNSLYHQGKPGLSNSFGAALWGVDFNLYCAANNISRVHMHQGTNYRYASWQPIDTVNTTIGTKAPYYGNIAVAAALGNLTEAPTQVKEIPLTNETESAYAIYASDVLKRVLVINMQQYNYSANRSFFASRPEKTYNFTLPTSCAGVGQVQRLIANGSDAITGITFNGLSFNYELENGRPVLLGNVTKDEVVYVGEDGIVQVPVPWSSAALLQVKC